MCKLCNKNTENMYQMNDGLYCEKHWKIGLKFQRLELDLKNMGYELEDIKQQELGYATQIS